MFIGDLVVQVFMAATLIAGVAMIAFTIGFWDHFRISEKWGRVLLGFLLVYSVGVRWYLILPGSEGFDFRFFYPPFDVLYISICIFFVINVLLRRKDG
jgi:hypothetical protein